MFSVREEGYSLIESVVVVIIVSVLLAISIPLYFQLIESARVRAHITNIKHIVKHLYLLDHKLDNPYSFLRWMRTVFTDMTCPWSGQPYDVYNGAIGVTEYNLRCYIGFLRRKENYLITAYSYDINKPVVFSAVQRWGGCHKEYVILKNISDRSINIGEWSISDGYGRYKYKFVFNNLVLEPNATVKVFSDTNIGGVWFRNGKPGRCFGGINNNYEGQYDVLYLLDHNNRIVDFTDEQNPVNGPIRLFGPN